MKTLKIELGPRSYPIYIGRDLLSNIDLFKPHVTGKQVFIVTNEVVAPLYLEKIQNNLAAFSEVHSIILADGETTKNLSTVQQVFSAMLEVPCERSATVIALGGGVVGDMAGFCAACYQRGVPFIQVPTTLLSQVDSSVGGKTGVNHPLGKNMIGAFYQPKAVVIDTDSLETLDDRQFSAGLAEVIKYGLLGDIAFVDFLEKNMSAILARDADLIAHIVEHSCNAKAAVVASDEREQGVRALLNLGHTFGHAIENAKGYGKWLHGEAVGLGMLMAADLSRRCGLINDADQARVKRVIAAAKLPVDGVDGVNAKQLYQMMSVDKKVSQGKLRFILYRQLGDAFISDVVEHNLLMQTLESFCFESSS